MNIRPHAQVIITKNRKIFCCPFFDSAKNQDFYRTVGGGIHFGELAIDAISREIHEEFNTELINLKQIEVAENIFIHMGKPGHEIIFIFTADFKDSSMYEEKNYPILDNPHAPGASWYSIDDFINGEKVLYPKAVLDFLSLNYK